ncbi:MAG: hypothetical protein SH850_09755 [Planctomycetaceae bacterium]|nr:hypothetical protein [Planctomycetaceae bacterium]
MTTTSTHSQLDDNRRSMAASQQELSQALQKYLARVLRRSWRCRSSSNAMRQRHAVLAGRPSDSEDLTDCSFERTVTPVSHETTE